MLELGYEKFPHNTTENKIYLHHAEVFFSYKEGIGVELVTVWSWKQLQDRNFFVELGMVEGGELGHKLPFTLY